MVHPSSGDIPYASADSPRLARNSAGIRIASGIPVRLPWRLAKLASGGIWQSLQIDTCQPICAQVWAMSARKYLRCIKWTSAVVAIRQLSDFPVVTFQVWLRNYLFPIVSFAALGSRSAVPRFLNRSFFGAPLDRTRSEWFCASARKYRWSATIGLRFSCARTGSFLRPLMILFRARKQPYSRGIFLISSTTYFLLPTLC